ncbi:MAG: MurT ligase domain-containing protein [Methanobacteriaceae archaeon]|jgi:UDP-N-acetylmuramyl tripeptide synthase|nr:MurT ligase domain-containing protein [Candidatus Methanorudis spinitermitis]
MSLNLRFNITVFIGKLIFFSLNLLGKQGTALPGKVALKLYPSILKEMGKKCRKILIISGTNGKTTTNNLINHILNGKYDNIVSNLKGANMIQGVVTSFIVNNKNSYDWGVFEVDEGSIPTVTKYINKPDYIILTNFFKDQLDRFGELENTIKIVHEGIKNLDSTLILNGDDPSSLKFNDLSNKKVYYGLNKNKFSKSADTVVETIFCSECGNKLNYEFTSYGNLGKYYCNKCGFKRPNLDYLVESIDIKDSSYEFIIKTKNWENEAIYFKYLGIYNIYNSISAIAFTCENELNLSSIKERIESFDYKLGRMETIKFPDKTIVLVLSKNPVGLSEVLKTFSYDESEKSLMFILNDTPADGKDVSWIWDADIEQINKMKNIANFYCSGIRAEDVALRIKYTGFDRNKIKTYPSKNENDIKTSLNDILNQNIEKVFIVGTFTAIPIAKNILMKKLSE